jgi:PAS domain S-box-containing protein
MAQTQKTSIFNKLEAIREHQVVEVNNWLDGRIGDVRTIAADNEIRMLERIYKGSEGYRQKDIDIIADARVHLNRFVRNIDAFYEIFILKPDTGKIMVSTDERDEGENHSNAPYFKETLKKRELFIKDIYYSDTEHEPSMVFSIPVLGLGDSDNIIGILVIRIDLERSLFELLLHRAGMGKTGEILIVNKDALTLNELRRHRHVPLNLKIKSQTALDAAKGNTGIVETTDYRGEPVLAAYTHIPRTGWGFVAKQDIKEIYAPIHQLRKWTFAVGISTMLGVILIAFRVSGYISKPVEILQNGTEMIGAGNLDYKIVIDRKDEIGRLSRSFDQMTDNLKIITASRDILNREISERKHAEEEIIKERDNAKRYLNIARVMLVIIDADQKVNLINKKGCEILGFKKEDIIGKDWFNTFLPERQRDEVKKIFEKLMAGEIRPVEYFENPVLTKDGKERIISWHNTVITDEAGNIIGTLSSGEDVTERKLAETALKESEGRWRSLVENAPDIIFTVDREGRIIFINHIPEGLTKEDVIGTKATDYVVPEYCETVRKSIKKVFETGDNDYYEISARGPHDKKFWYSTRLGPVKDEDEVVAVMLITRDITERKQLEKEILKIEERERRHIGHDLHDNIGQQLTGISFKSQRLENKLKEKQSPEAESAASITRLIDKVKEDADHLSAGLSPVLDDMENLSTALEGLAVNAERMFNIPCFLKCDEHINIKDKAAVLHLYRIAQEALTNAAKHAGPESVGISVYKGDKKIIMAIKDDGAGISIERGKTKGMGLQIMKYRANIIGALLSVRPDVGGGTLVECIYDVRESGIKSAEKENS